MYVDVIHPAIAQQHGVIRPQPGMQQGFHPPLRRFLPPHEHPRDQAGNPFPTAHSEPECPQQSHNSNRLQAQNLRFRSRIGRRALPRIWPAHAARNDPNSPPPQFLDFRSHIGLDGRRKLIREISDSQQGIQICTRSNRRIKS